MDLVQNLLEIIENDPKIEIGEIAALTGRSDGEIRDCISELESNGTIRKYKTIIDWEKVNDGFVYAIIGDEVRITAIMRLGGGHGLPRILR